MERYGIKWKQLGTHNKHLFVLEKRIVGENGIGYTLGADGLYYPDLKLPEGTHYEIGRYGRMRGEYLKTCYNSRPNRLWCLQIFQA
jgi:hypothetical protein